MSYLKLQEAPLTFRTSLDEGQEERRHDTLDLLPYAQALRDFIIDCDTPMTIGIQGDWGIGKTSLMNMLRGSEDAPQSGLLGDVHCKLVNFETWPYSQFNHGRELSIACLQALTLSVGDALGGADGVDQQAVEQRLGEALAKLQRVRRHLSSSGPEDSPEAPDFGDVSALMIRFRHDFQALVGAWSELDARNRVVIFIDDLDRIPPLEALQLLEAVKNFLESAGCVYVLAVDYEVVQQGMAEKLGRAVQKTSGKAFYDKIIQLPFVMPYSSYRLEDYVVGLLAKTGFPFSSEAERDPDSATYFVAITLCTVGRNPRNIKRVMNYARLLEHIRRQSATESDPRESKILYALICMQIAWPELFAHFVNDPTVDTVTNLENWQYLGKLPEAQPLLDRVPDREKFMNDVATFFDTLFSVLDENDDGQIDSREMEPVIEVMTLARMTAVEVRERPRDFFVRKVRENNAGESALVETFLENVFMKSIWYLGSECQYRKSGDRYVTIVHEGKQIGSLVSLKSQPFVFRLTMPPEQVARGLNDYWKSKHAVRKEAITLARSMFDREASLTGFGDTVVDFSKMTNIPAKEAIGMMNALFRIVTGDSSLA
jgi:hypothetical protein